MASEENGRHPGEDGTEVRICPGDGEAGCSALSSPGTGSCGWKTTRDLGLRYRGDSRLRRKAGGKGPGRRPGAAGDERQQLLITGTILGVELT